MDRRLATALTELGLTATEAEIYVALLQRSQDGPLSAYKLAQDLGRDPANTSKTLGAMAKNGSVRASGRQPRLYRAAAPADFTGELVARIRARQREALELLEAVGKPPAGAAPRPLETTESGLDVARRLLGEATRVVLVDASPELLLALAPELGRLVERQGTSVLVRSTAPVAVRGARVWVDRHAGTFAPGPWLRLAVDGRACLELVVHPEGGGQLLHGQWSRNASQAFLCHRNLVGELVLADLLDLLREGASSELVRRHAEDQLALILRQVGWRERWREEGLPDHQPAIGRTEPPRAMAAAGGSGEIVEPEAPARSEEEDPDDGGPLRFIFRRPRKDDD